MVVIGGYLKIQASLYAVSSGLLPINMGESCMNWKFLSFIRVIHVWTLSLPTHLSALHLYFLAKSCKLMMFFPNYISRLQMEGNIKVVLLACLHQPFLLFHVTTKFNQVIDSKHKPLDFQSKEPRSMLVSLKRPLHYHSLFSQCLPVSTF